LALFCNVFVNKGLITRLSAREYKQKKRSLQQQQLSQRRRNKKRNQISFLSSFISLISCSQAHLYALSNNIFYNIHFYNRIKMMDLWEKNESFRKCRKKVPEAESCIYRYENFHKFSFCLFDLMVSKRGLVKRVIVGQIAQRASHHSSAFHTRLDTILRETEKVKVK
jgi:ribosomal protein L32